MTAAESHSQMDGPVMADIAAWNEDHPGSIPLAMDDTDIRKSGSDCWCRVCRIKTGDREKGEMRNEIDSQTRFWKSTSVELTDQQYIVCPRFVNVWYFKTRTWGLCDSSRRERHADGDRTCVGRFSERAAVQSTDYRELSHESSSASKSEGACEEF
jgi:hypothetical protein